MPWSRRSWRVARPPSRRWTRTALGRLPGSRWAFSALLRSRAFLRSSAGFGGCFVDRRRIDAEFIDTFVEPLRTPSGIDGALRVLRAFDYASIDRVAELHARIQAPVHLVWGEHDPTFPVSLLEPFAASFPTFASVTRLSGKLLVHDEQPEAYAAVVRRAVS